MTGKVCSEFFARFPKYQQNIKNEDRIEFMLSHPVIRYAQSSIYFNEGSIGKAAYT
jgi:hypothetical protein